MLRYHGVSKAREGVGGGGVLWFKMGGGGDLEIPTTTKVTEVPLCNICMMCAGCCVVYGTVCRLGSNWEKRPTPPSDHPPPLS